MVEKKEITHVYPLANLTKSPVWRCSAKCLDGKPQSSTDESLYNSQKPVAILMIFGDENNIIYQEKAYSNYRMLVKTECQKCKGYNYYPAAWFSEGHSMMKPEEVEDSS